MLCIKKSKLLLHLVCALFYFCTLTIGGHIFFYAMQASNAPEIMDPYQQNQQSLQSQQQQQLQAQYLARQPQF